MSLPNPGEVAGDVRTACSPPHSSGKAATTAAWQAEVELLLCPSRSAA